MGGLILAGIGLSPWYPLTATLMFVGGLGGGFFMNLNQTLVQANTPHELMGRVVSIHTLGFQGLGPFGALLAGALAIALTAPIWMAIGGAIAAAMALLTLLTQPFASTHVLTSLQRGRPASPSWISAVTTG